MTDVTPLLFIITTVLMPVVKQVKIDVQCNISLD